MPVSEGPVHSPEDFPAQVQPKDRDGEAQVLGVVVGPPASRQVRREVAPAGQGAMLVGSAETAVASPVALQQGAGPMVGPLPASPLDGLDLLGGPVGPEAVGDEDDLGDGAGDRLEAAVGAAAPGGAGGLLRGLGQDELEVGVEDAVSILGDLVDLGGGL